MNFIIVIIAMIISYKLYKKFIRPAIPSSRISVKIKKIILILILVVTPILVYFLIKIDKQLFYYGKNNWGLHDELPFKITPQYWGYNYGNLGFVLLRNNETLIAHGLKDWTSDFQINEILKYGFNKEKLAAFVNDSLGKEYYVVCEKQTDNHSKQEIKINVVSKQNFTSTEQLRWTDIKNVSTGQMEQARNYLEMLLILLVLIATYNLFKNRKRIAVGSK